MIQYQSHTLDGETLDLASKSEVYYFGPEMILRRCKIIVRVPSKALIVMQTQFIECEIDCKSKLSSYRWSGALLRRCRFSGTYVGNEFGKQSDDVDPVGGIEGGDFSQAILDGCGFNGCDPSQIKFPSWPCFTILDPAKRSGELARVAWPGKLAIPMNFESVHPSTVAITFFATRLAEKYGAALDGLRTLLSGLPGVIL